MVTATTLLLKQDAQVHDWVSKGTSLGGRAHLSSWLFSLLRCKMSLILPKRLYGVTPSDSLCMLFLCLDKDQNVIQIDYHNAFRYEILEDIVHHGLEGGWAVSHSEEHHQVL